MNISRLHTISAQVALILALPLGLAAPGLANSDGVTGASGLNQGFFCRNCHTGGTIPTVELEGPNAMELGATATFRFTVTSNAPAQIAAGLNVAAADGTLAVVPDQGLRFERGELTHSEPKENDDNGQAAFDFTWQAPASPGVYTLFAAGTSADFNEVRTGDRAERTTLDVFVGVEPPTPTATVAPPTPTATATPDSAQCVGDCDASGDVTVDEVITGVNIALGTLPTSMCPAFDASADGVVTVDEILQAVNAALTGCR